MISNLLAPYLWLHLMVAAGLVRVMLRWPERRRMLLWWLGVPFLALTVAALPVTGYLARGTLEWAFPPLLARPSQTRAIVVLSGYLRPADSWRGAVTLGEDTLYRCLKAAQMYHDGPPCPVFVSGGIVGPDLEMPSLAAEMAKFLVDHGVAPEQIVQENVSRSTYENAVQTSRLLQERGIARVLLVTDAIHLRRAVACFAKQGVAVEPCGCRYVGGDMPTELTAYLPTGESAEDLRRVLHEWVGLGWYWFKGRI